MISEPNRPALFCFGCGYTALALARGLLGRGEGRGEGWRVRGTAREPARLAALVAAGVEAMAFDRARPLPPEALDGMTHLLSSVPPDQAGDPVLDACGGELARRAGQFAWVGYLSTTVVYGDRQGGWVDEASELRPEGARGRRRVEAEQGWLRLQRDRGLPVHLFRLAGIYGPGRSALDQVRAGRARRIVKPGQLFSRVHVADIVQVLRASMARPRPGAIYNVADDEAAPPQDLVLHACRLLGVAPPPEEPFAGAELSEMARSFYAENKRVRNDRIKRELGVVLRYPDYRTGLAALLREDSGAAS